MKESKRIGKRKGRRWPIVVGVIAAVVVAAVIAAGGLTLYIMRERKREREALARRRERRMQRLRESGISEEEFERLRRERFGDRPGRK